MTEHRMSRTLVKSPPELWAEVSDPAALARHLGEFGEIRITRVEQESAVEWESERASGAVELEATKWGTRVNVIARTERPGEDPAPADSDSMPGVEEAPLDAAPAPRRGLLARLLRRRPRPARAPAPALPDLGPAGAQRADHGTVAVLFAMLDTLGSAQHRPFSRD